MWVYDPKRECNYCGATDTSFFAQKQRKKQLTINNKCFECKKKERSRYYYKKEKYKRYLEHVRKNNSRLHLS